MDDMTRTKKEPLVYVCVPAYNAERTLRDTLDSIAAQTYRNIRVIVVDNASTDSTNSIAASFATRDDRFSVVRNPVNVGGEQNYTRCIELSGGDYTAIYHSDDVYEPEIIEREVSALEAEPSAGAVFCAVREINGAGDVTSLRLLPRAGGISEGGAFDISTVLRSVLKAGNFMAFPSAMARTRIYKEEITRWRPELFATSADLDVWLRIAEKHKLSFIPEPLMRCRVNESSTSYRLARSRVERQDFFKVMAYYVGKYSGTLVGPSELTDYRLIQLKEDISIAINLLIRGERGRARELSSQVFRTDNLMDSFRGRWQLAVYLSGVLAWMLSLVPLGEAGRALVSKVRHG